MKRNIIKTFVMPVVALIALAGCDNVDENDRYIELSPINAKRVVLLEEFTGQDCTNCPDGHRIAAQLKEQYGDAFIPVSIHAGPLSWSEADYDEYGLGIPEGEAYYKSYSINSIPSGVVNRNSGVLNRTDWASRVRAEIEKEAPLALELTPTFDPNSGVININVNIKPNQSLAGSLTVWILESGIVGYQYDNGKDVGDYVHNHVLRAVVTDTWGDNVTLSAGVFTDRTYTYSLPDNNKSHWNVDNLSVVAFVSNDTGVLQAVEAKVAKD